MWSAAGHAVQHRPGVAVQHPIAYLPAHALHLCPRLVERIRKGAVGEFEAAVRRAAQRGLGIAKLVPHRPLHERPAVARQQRLHALQAAECLGARGERVARFEQSPEAAVGERRQHREHGECHQQFQQREAAAARNHGASSGGGALSGAAPSGASGAASGIGANGTGSSLTGSGKKPLTVASTSLF